MPLPKRAARARRADTAVRRTKHIFAKSIPCRRKKSKSFFHNPRFFAARPTVLSTRPRTAPRRKGICTLSAPFFPPASFPSSFPLAPHTAPWRKGICTLFAPFFPPASFSPSFPPAPAPHRGEKAFPRFSHRFSCQRLSQRLSHRLSHPPPHRAAAKRRPLGFRTVFPARVFPAVLPTRPHTAPRRKGVHLIFASFFSPASFSSSFSPRFFLFFRKKS